MANLLIKTHLDNVYVVGDFNDWDIDKAITVTRRPNNKLLRVEDMPQGEYKVLCCRGWNFGEERYPTTNRRMPNRYFNGKEDEKIFCYF